MQLSLMNGSPPRAEDVNGLVTLSVTTRMYGGTPDVSKKLDLVIPESGIIPFTLSLSEHDSSSVSLNVCSHFCLHALVVVLCFYYFIYLA